MRTGENEMGLKKIMDMTRMISVIILFLHFYVVCYGVFKTLGWTHPVSDRLLDNIGRTGLFRNFANAKWISLSFLTISLLGVTGKKGQEFNFRLAATYIMAGLLFYFASYLILILNLEDKLKAILYISSTSTGYILYVTGGAIFARIITKKLSPNVFNTFNETFPQEERLIENKYSVHFRTEYHLRDQLRQGWVNRINGFRGTLIMGLSGSGKTRYLVKELIRQEIELGYAMFIHDFKYPDLTNVAHYYFQKNLHKYRCKPAFYVLNFEDILHRCNPLMPKSIRNLSDAASASRAIYLGLNQQAIEKQGDFWIESSINFVSALIWYLRKYQDGIFCTLPHVIELAQVDFEKLFTILRAEPTLEVLVAPFIKAYQEDAGKQLIGQISGAAISLGTLSTEHLYYVLSGDDFTMDINDPENPKIVCIANNPQVANVYSAVISLYLNNLQKLLKMQDEQPCSIILEEFANISWAGVDKFISVCRDYLVSVTLVIQDVSQLVLHYGKRQADVILSMVGNVISGQVTGESARQLADRFGKILQDKETLSINSSDGSVNLSKQLDYAIPQATIASLSSGEFVGMIADNPDQPIALKMFHGKFTPPAKMPKNYSYKSAGHEPIDEAILTENFYKIKADIKNLVQTRLHHIMNDPSLKNAVVKKNF